MNNISIRFAGFYEETSADENASWEIHYLISGEKKPRRFQSRREEYMFIARKTAIAREDSN